MEEGGCTGQIGVMEAGIDTILWFFESDDTTVIRGATGSDVYNSLIGDNEGQFIAVKFEGLA